jgi:hypothetical protein
MDPTRLTKRPPSSITEQKSITDDSSNVSQEQRKVQQGSVPVKDSFEVATTNPLFTVDTTKGELHFGDGIHGRIPGSSASNIKANYQSGLGQAGNTPAEDLRFYAEKVKYFNDVKQEVRDYFNDKKESASAEKLDQLTPGKNPNVIEDLMTMLRESIHDNNEDKKHYLVLLDKMNKISSEISNQLDSISDASRRLSKKEKDDDD